MTPERRQQLDSVLSDRLTSEEMRQGWHFCYDWDYMLVNYNDTEGEGSCCECGPWHEDQIKAVEDIEKQKA